MSEAIVNSLLRDGLVLRRVRGLRLERAVHPFVTPVLLGMAWLRALGRDSELDPPDAQGGQTADPRRRERHAVVAADVLGKPELSEHALEHLACRPFLRARQRVACQQVPRLEIADGQRVASRAIAKREVTLEVDAPDVVRAFANREPRQLPRSARSTSARDDQALPLQHCAERARCGQWRTRPQRLESRTQLLWSPGRMLPSKRHDGVDLRIAQRLSVRTRCAARLFQRTGTATLVARQPLVPRLAADPESSADPCETFIALVHRR